MSKGYLSKKGRAAYLSIVLIDAHPSELDHVFINPTVKLSNLGLVQLLALHNSLYLLLVEVVVLVEVDCDISDLLLMLREKKCDSRLALIQDILHFFIDHRKPLLTHLVLVRRYVACIFTEHAELLNCTVCHFCRPLQVTSTACCNLVVADEELFSAVATHRYIYVRKYLLFGQT